MLDLKFEDLTDTARNWAVIRNFEFHDAESLRPSLLVCIYGAI
jgi:hypothetical protein